MNELYVWSSECVNEVASDDVACRTAMMLP